MRARKKRVANWASLRPPIKPGSGGEWLKFGRKRGLSPRLVEPFHDGQCIHSCTVKLPF